LSTTQVRLLLDMAPEGFHQKARDQGPHTRTRLISQSDPGRGRPPSGKDSFAIVHESQGRDPPLCHGPSKLDAESQPPVRPVRATSGRITIETNETTKVATLRMSHGPVNSLGRSRASLRSDSVHWCTHARFVVLSLYAATTPTRCLPVLCAFE